MNLPEESDRLELSTVNILQPRGDIDTTWCVEAAAMLIIIITTVAGNTAVMNALRRLQRAPAHYPLASLATADLLVGVFVLPIAAARELFVFQLTSFTDWAICSCWSTLDVLCCTASILSLCTLGWERWCCITAPLARAKRHRRAKLLAVLVWPVSTAVALPTAFIPSAKNYHEGEMPKACTVNTNVGYVFFSVSFSFYVPASVMVGFYVCILRLLSLPLPIRAHRGQGEHGNKIATNRNEVTEHVKSSQNNNNITRRTEGPVSPKGCQLNVPVEPSAANSSHLPKLVVSLGGLIPRQRRATRTIIMLMSLFLFCWTPFFIMLPVDSLCECVCDATWLWCTWLGYANSAFNPLVYAAASPSVRRALQASLTTSSSARTTVAPLSPSVRRP
ncbi:octopamine receptor-like [Achroia grisella]|uniref:octopamine receptor-like n=1 Tax=Achroia grisella TaxID=688607 RepID=UPI0027D29BF9|nr:octopamine receptor-like [Achroia grisella]